MNLPKLALLIIFLSLLSFCKNSRNEIDEKLDWKGTNYILWKSKNGDLGFKTVDNSDNENKKDVFITSLVCDSIDAKKVELKSVIDTLSFEYLGSSFYKDKNNIYQHYAMADGGFFRIVNNADVNTFKVIGDCYAKDKNHIYGARELNMDDVDYETFKTEKGCGCYAKDKNSYYFWADTISLKEIKDYEVFDKLNKI